MEKSPPAQALQVSLLLRSRRPLAQQPTNITLLTTTSQNHGRLADHALSAWGALLRHDHHFHVCLPFHRGSLSKRTTLERPHCTPGIRMVCCRYDNHSPRKPRMARRNCRHACRLACSPVPIHTRLYLLRPHLREAAPATTAFAPNSHAG